MTFGREVHEKRSGRLEIGTGGSFTRTFLVTTTDAVNEGPYVVCGCPGVPRLGDPLPESPLYTCRTVTPEYAGGSPSLSWYVTCEYSRRSNDPDEDHDNPLNAPVEIEARGVKVQKIVTHDLNGDPILNTAGDAFDPPLEVTRTHPVIVFTRNEPSFTFDYALSYMDHVNSGSYLGAGAGTVKCNDIAAQKMFAQAQEYWQVRYEFEYNPDGWQPQVLNAGYMQLFSGGKYKILDSDGRDVSEPWPLDASGERIAANFLPDSAIYLTFTVFPSANFNLLGLPT